MRRVVSVRVAGFWHKAAHYDQRTFTISDEHCIVGQQIAGKDDNM